MTTAREIFRTGLTRRWHRNPDVCHTNDPIGGHAGRVARLIALLHPYPTRYLLIAALAHDDGEGVVGDVAKPDKDSDPDFAEAVERRESKARSALWGGDPLDNLDAHEMRWLKFADRLDALQWAQHYTPHALRGDGWPEQIEALRAEAAYLGCFKLVASVLSEAEKMAIHPWAIVRWYRRFKRWAKKRGPQEARK